MALTGETFRRALRMGDTAEEVAEADRLREAASAIVDAAGGAAAPGGIRDEAIVRVGGYLYDMPNAPRGAGWANAIRNSGARALLAPHLRRGLGSTGNAHVVAQPTLVENIPATTAPPPFRWYITSSTTGTLTAADFTGSESDNSTGPTAQLPGYTGNRYVAYAYPSSDPFIVELTARVSVLSFFTRYHPNIEIAGVDCRVYRSALNQWAVFGGTFTLTRGTP